MPWSGWTHCEEFFFPGRGKVALQTGLIVSTKASTNLGSIHMCFLIPQSLVSLLKLINFCFYFFIFLPFFLFLSIFLAFFPKLNKVYFKNILTWRVILNFLIETKIWFQLYKPKECEIQNVKHDGIPKPLLSSYLPPPLLEKASGTNWILVVFYREWWVVSWN